MNCKTRRGFIPIICLVICLAAIFPLFALSQDSEQQSPKIKEFGNSLKGKSEKAASQNKEVESTNPNEDDVIKVETNLVRTDVLVIDQKGQAVLGLKVNDFIVTENNVSQEVGTFSLGDSVEIPRSIVLIIDYSGSQIPFIQTSINAAKVLIDKLNQKDRMAIVTDDIELLAEFTHDKTLLKNKLDSLVDRVKHGEFVNGEFKNGQLGKSLQYSALMATLNELFDTEDIRPIVIFQTDGDQFFNIKSTKPKLFQSNTSLEPQFSIEDLFNKIEKSRATIYSVISGFSLVGLSPDERLKKTADVTENLWREKKLWKPGTPQFANYVERLYLEQNSLKIAAQSSGGFAESLEIPEQADEIYSRIFNGINNRYLIGYYPTNQERDGQRRIVKIEVRSHPEYTVWGRKFYFAPQDKPKNN